MTIYIPQNIYCQIQAFVKQCKYEISGLGRVVRYKNGFLIERVKLLEQEVSPTSTVLHSNGLGKLYSEIIAEEGTLSNWKLWWHSHAKMETFWSSQDEKTIIDFDNETNKNNWLLSVVFNHEMDWKGRLDVYSPTHLTQHIYDLKIIQINDPATTQACALEISEKVTVKSTKLTKEPEYIPPKNGFGKDFFENLKREIPSYNLVKEPL